MKVLVAGAGLAGLTAARELEAHGADVTIVEARNRVGGRVHTLREGFAEGQHAEAGADLIEGEQTHVVGVARELGLEPVRILRHGWGFYGADSKGRLRVRRSLHAFEKAADRLESEIEAYQLAENRWSSPVVAAIARQSVADWLARTRADAGFAAAIRGLRGFFLADPEDLSLIALVDEFASGDQPGTGRMYRIADGNDRLTTLAAKRLRGRLILNCMLRRVSQDGSGVRATVEDTRQREIQADYMVLALPASTLRDVVFEPGLPDEQARAIVRLRYGAATRVLLQFATRFWRRPGQPAAYGSDQPIGAVWDGNEQQSRRPGILTLLAGGRASAELRTIVGSGGVGRAGRQAQMARPAVASAPASHCHLGGRFPGAWRVRVLRSVVRARAARVAAARLPASGVCGRAHQSSLAGLHERRHRKRQASGGGNSRDARAQLDGVEIWVMASAATASGFHVSGS